VTSVDGGGGGGGLGLETTAMAGSRERYLGFISRISFLRFGEGRFFYAFFLEGALTIDSGMEFPIL